MNSAFESLRQALSDKRALVAVVGLGYVGMPLATHFHESGYRVLGIDVDEKKLASLKEGKSYLSHLSAQWIPAAIESETLVLSSNYSLLQEADAIIICVPTPLGKHREPNLKYVIHAGRQIGKFLKPGALVSLESTTYPGTTTEVLQPLLSENGRKAGRDFFLVFSPEREDPGNETWTVSNIPKVIGGTTPQCTELAQLLYSAIFTQTVPVSQPAAAELCKLLENIFRSVNIALVNELKMLCGRMDLDIWEIIEAAATKPFGYMPFYPGPGLGGHCIPIDPFYLTWKAREYGFATRFIELSGEINTSMPHYVLSRCMEALNETGRPLKGSRVLVLGAAYKKDINDLRESPSIPLMNLLEKNGAIVQYNDPFIPYIAAIPGKSVSRNSVALTSDALKGCDLVLIATAHSCYDPEFIVEHAPLVVDTRNITGKVTKDRHKIFQA
ncbi:MAG: nucleotide sugar dehydrogenase [Candidatus Hydrogenedens sp.]|jgi:UDP-N-acetyl-D-glucosamine dehydrogenase|nr:nucleotide sugar dehydrogenase [Candidatus Hydrogenedens sp.]